MNNGIEVIATFYKLVKSTAIPYYNALGILHAWNSNFRQPLLLKFGKSIQIFGNNLSGMPIVK